MSKLEYSRSWFAQGVDHHGLTNCNAKIVNRFLEVQAYSSFGALARSDHFIDFTTSKRASQEHTDHRCRVMHGLSPLRELLSGLFPYNSTGKGLDAEDGSEADTSIDFESTPLQEAPARESPDTIRDEDCETLAIGDSRIDRGNLGHPHPWGNFSFILFRQ
ncbi:hypothetical protein CRG98_029272 [Punica granatum]|uniref:Uncharacterized protein n=1 Tax=Punica granatum TaxID=22663 RepID=A0A2I0J3N6_PUNGR|nr:hypothetical protein CRG98_029272 [Punica granatum]